ncbi:hypothetical protein ACFL14_01300 [Patescibacteria group bacterium]
MLKKWRTRRIQMKLEATILILLEGMDKAALQFYLFKEALPPWRKKTEEAAWALQVGLKTINSALPVCRTSFQNHTVLRLKKIMAQIG